MTTPRIEVIEASDADRPVIENLAQLYQYDFSEMSRRDLERGHHGNVKDDGLFHNIDFDWYYGKPEHHEFIVRVDGYLAGFVLVAPGRSFRDPDETVVWVDEFFVMRKYRRLGVGEHVARSMFDRFDGTWQVAQMSINLDAQVFWRGVIGRYTNENYEERWFDDDNWLGPVQYFRTPVATP
ncbi:MAG TPA: GNAT family N-acetyltransferase [Actinomycetota bacterium]|nr:GNAT family N-acetyltransferase [Actinomycetota bacterium]